jgi:hypothetical protein
MKSFGAALPGLVGVLTSLFFVASGIGLIFFTDSYMGLIAKYILPFMNIIAGLCLAASIVVGLPLLISRKTSGWSAVICSITSMAWGFSISLFSLLLVYAAWGKIWTLVSMAFLPFMPLTAAIAQGLVGNWNVVGTLALNFLIWILVMAVGTFASQRAGSV